MWGLFPHNLNLDWPHDLVWLTEFIGIDHMALLKRFQQALHASSFHSHKEGLNALHPTIFLKSPCSPFRIEWGGPVCSAECSRRDAIWPFRLGHKGIIDMPWIFGILIWVSQLLCYENAQVVLRRVQHGEKPTCSTSLTTMLLNYLEDRSSERSQH